MANLTLIRSKADFIGTLNPKAWDAVKPHIPFVFSNALVELMVADIVKSVSAAVADKALARETMDLSMTMAKQASSSMLSAWDPEDGICPPWPWPWPRPFPWTDFGPQPDPWVPWTPIAAAQQLELAHILTRLAGLTTSKEFNKSLIATGTKIARLAATTMADEFEKCGTVPRKPFPPRR